MQTYYQACRLVVALFTIETSHYIIITICITHIVFTHNIDYITFIVLYVHYWWHYTHCILQSSLFTSLFFGCQFVLPVALFREVSVRFFLPTRPQPLTHLSHHPTMSHHLPRAHWELNLDAFHCLVYEPEPRPFRHRVPAARGHAVHRTLITCKLLCAAFVMSCSLSIIFKHSFTIHKIQHTLFESSSNILFDPQHCWHNIHCMIFTWLSTSATGTRTRVARVRAEYPNQLDYSGLIGEFKVCILNNNFILHIIISHMGPKRAPTSSESRFATIINCQRCRPPCPMVDWQTQCWWFNYHVCVIQKLRHHPR